MSDGIVQARFTPGGKIYHYHCPEARIGDRIRSSGMYSDSAEVVGLGRTGSCPGICRSAKVVKPTTLAELSGVLKTVWSSEQMQRALYPVPELLFPVKKENPTAMTHEYALSLSTTAEERIEQTEKLLKKQKKALKAQAKQQAADKAKAKERARLRQTAIATFEEVSTDIGYPAAARVAAAVELLKAVGK